jgi:hypothetical protein
MILVKVLERKLVIQLFGLGFFLAPAINTLLSMSLQIVENRWTYFQMTKVLGAQGFSSNVLSVCSIILGIAMLSGSRKSWRFALALIGIHLLVQLPRLGQDIRSSWIYGLGFLVNIATFLFIGDQLVFKQPSRAKEIPEAEEKESDPKIAIPKSVALDSAPVFDPPRVAFPLNVEIAEPIKPLPSQPRLEPAPRHVVSKQKILVSFDGSKPWAQIAKIDNDGVELKQVGERPQNVENKQVEMAFGPHLTMKMKFSGELGNRIYFKYTNTTAFELKQLNNWLLQQSQSA